MKKWEQTGKRGEESSLRVCCVSQHIAAHTVCEKASREIKKKKQPDIVQCHSEEMTKITTNLSETA